jgi:hypothetical protein
VEILDYEEHTIDINPREYGKWILKKMNVYKEGVRSCNVVNKIQHSTHLHTEAP